MKRNHRIRPSLAVLAAALSSMALYACGQNSQQAQTAVAAGAAAPPALPLTTGAETAPVYAPSVNALPSAPRPKIVRVASQADQYAYVDQAQSMGQALGSAPPDYGFDYNGARPWVWRTRDNAARLVEPVDGGYRYYYYQPGAAQPYLIRDPQYAYGFNNGELVVVYDARGNVLPPQYMDQQLDYAGRYLARARALYRASLDSQRRSVIAANWAARRAQINAEQAQWAQQQSQYAAWQDYHRQHEAEQQAYWQAEQQHREQAAAQFDQWHDGGYQGSPPPASYAPVAGAALVGAVIGGLVAGNDHHRDDRGPPQGGQGYPPPNSGPGFDHRGGQPNPQQDQAAVIAEARQQQAQQDAARQAQAQQQAQAASAARDQAIAQGRQQQAAADAARQADAQRQANALGAARNQQAQADARAQAEVRMQAATQARQQEQSQAASERQAQDAARVQANQARASQAQAAQALAATQVQEASRAQAMQAHQLQAAQAAAARQAQETARAQAGAQAQAARQAQDAAKTQAVQAHQQQVVKVAAAQAAAKAEDRPHPHNGGPRPEDGPHQANPQQ